MSLVIHLIREMMPDIFQVRISVSCLCVMARKRSLAFVPAWHRYHIADFCLSPYGMHVQQTSKQTNNHVEPFVIARHLHL